MALDRFVHWDRRKPSQEELKAILEDYLGGVGEIRDITGNGKAAWWNITIPGRPTLPFARIKGHEERAESVAVLLRNERWFEVYVDEKYVDIMTRQADEFTNVVAKGFADLLARFYDARVGE